MKSVRISLPFHFGPVAQPLFGCYHEPDGGLKRECAVVICHPIAHEYVYSHRALRQLAVRLCEAGFPVLRFDYYGCGDSSGDTNAGTIQRWLDDVSAAIAEVKQRSKLTDVCLVGLRLGGALAAMLGAKHGDIKSMVLWDPVTDGGNYLQGLQILQKEHMRSRLRPCPSALAHEDLEILGFPYTHELCREIGKIKLHAISCRPDRSVFVIHSRPSDYDGAMHSFDMSQPNWEYQTLPIAQIWLPTTNGSLLIPGQALQSITSWACRIHS